MERSSTGEQTDVYAAGSDYIRILTQGITPESLVVRTQNDVANGIISPKTADDLHDLNARLTSSRQREDLLRALHDTATDLGLVRDVEEVLLAIVRRTRSLSGSDIAYIALNDVETNEVYIRKCDGVITEQYRTLRLPIGTGVIGRVATGIGPYSTSDYASDTRFSRIGYIDEIVQTEGVRAILGVPLNLHGNVIGALLIGDRTPRAYTPEMFDLVDTLSKHAAVALGNAQRFSAITHALDRLGKEHTTRIEEMTELQQLIDLDERLIEAIAGEDGIRRFLRTVMQTFQIHATVIDAESGVLATTRPHREKDFDHVLSLGPRAQEAIAFAFATGEPQSYSEEGVDRTVVCSKSGGRHLATLVIEASIARPHYPLLKRIGAFLTVLRVFDEATHRSETLMQFEVIESLISESTVDREQTRRRAARHGLKSGDALTLFAVHAPDADPRRVETAIRSALGSRSMLMAQHSSGGGSGTHTCAVVVEDGDVVRRAKDALSSAAIAAKVAYSGPAHDFGELPAAHRRAERGLLTLQAVGAIDGLVNSDALGATGLLFDAARYSGAQHELTNAIDPILDYDRRHHTELALTAWMYLENQSNLTTTSADLFVHRNTVRQRLERVAHLIGTDWLEPSRRLDVHIALRIWRLVEKYSRTEPARKG